MANEFALKAAIIAKKYGIAMAKELAIEAAFPALQAAVKESPNKIDDLVLASLEPLLKKALEELLNKVA